MKIPSASNTLEVALGVSVLVHALLLSVRFIDPQAFSRVFQDTPLEVILVNAKGDERPEKAQAIAQANLAGGGEADKGRATSPLPPEQANSAGEEAEDVQRQIEAMQEQQMVLLTQKKQELASLRSAETLDKSDNRAAREREQRKRQLIKQLAEIEQRINEENARPKKRYISPATREEAYAQYYDRLRRKIEERGTRLFPEANGRKLYGELTMVVTVDNDGKVLETEIVESSGIIALDRRARSIARRAGPFGQFNEAMRKRADQIVVVARFKFTQDEILETQLTNR